MSDNKNKILEAMYQLISVNGYDKTSTTQLCELSGITKPTLYYYYKSKEELLLAFIQNYWYPYGDSIKSCEYVATQLEFREYLFDIGKSIIFTISKDNKYGRIMSEIWILDERLDSVHQIMKKINIEYDEKISSIIEKGNTLNSFRLSTEQVVLADMLTTFLTGLGKLVGKKSPDYLIKLWDNFVISILKDEVDFCEEE